MNTNEKINGRCPKCHGFEREHIKEEGYFESCAECGYIFDQLGCKMYFKEMTK
jgi:hypothetical protein